MNYQKPNLLIYRATQAVSTVFAACVFKRKILRNEIKDAKGPFLVIANHQAAYDFVNLIGICHRPMSFVISNSFYQSLPIKGILNKLGVIPKQQFQTNVSDLKKIRAVIQAGEPEVIYPAGLMCEDGLSTPIPVATCKLLKWLGVDVYMAKTCGTYFAMPKWTSGFRPGKTTLDVYKLFSKEDLAGMDISEIREKTQQALLFDAYREQENNPEKYWGGKDLQGLEHVLYQCPHCGKEFAMEVRDGDRLCCTVCGYEQQSDEYGFLHNVGAGQEIRYVSDWSRLIYERLKEKILSGQLTELRCGTKIQMIDYARKKFVEVGQGTLTLTQEQFVIDAQIRGEKTVLTVPIAGVPSLPFTPGKFLEVQQGSDIYRCVLEDGKLVMKFINMVKIFYELNKTVSPSRKKSPEVV